MRALLRVAGDDPAELGRALAAGADGLILDAAAAPRLRNVAGATTDAPPVYVLVGSARAEGFDAEVAAAVGVRPHGVWLAGAEGAADVQHVAALLAVAEARARLADGAVRIVAMIATARGTFGIDALATASPRLEALAWDAAALAADLGAASPREACGEWIAPLGQVRGALLLAAAAHGLTAVDTAAGADLPRFETDAETALRHGFAARIATNASEVAALRRR